MANEERLGIGDEVGSQGKEGNGIYNPRIRFCEAYRGVCLDAGKRESWRNQKQKERLGVGKRLQNGLHACKETKGAATFKGNITG